MLHLFPSPAIFLAWQENSPSLPSVISNWVVEVKTAAEKVWIELSSWIYVGEVTDRIWGDLLGTSSTSRWEGRPSPGRRGRPPAPSPLQWWSTPACTPLSDWLEIDPVTTPILSFDEIRRDTVLWLVYIIVLLRQLSYAKKNQRKAGKAPSREPAHPSLCLWLTLWLSDLFAPLWCSRLTFPRDVTQLVESCAGVSPSVSSSHCRPELQFASMFGSGSVSKLPEVFSRGESLESNYSFYLSLKAPLQPLRCKESLWASNSL